jgi:NAD(P)-dependent dehydrogenase (short-subunit alcohol dehydrogenase family)
MPRLKDKVAIVTGGGAGIGAATCRRFGAEGASVAVVDINGESAERTAHTVVSAGGRAVALPTDLGRSDEVLKMVDDTVSAFGGVDVIFNNAAALELRDDDHATADIDLATWQRQLDVNLTGPMLVAKAAIPHMVEGAGGSIIFTSSAAALLGEERRTGYATTKAGLLGLSRAIAVQYGKQGIRSNVVAPGQILTEFVRTNFSQDTLEALEDAYLTPTAGEPDDVAALIAFLASEESSYITGQVIPIDGGLSAVLPFVPIIRRMRRIDE